MLLQYCAFKTQAYGIHIMWIFYCSRLGVCFKIMSGSSQGSEFLEIWSIWKKNSNKELGSGFSFFFFHFFEWFCFFPKGMREKRTSFQCDFAKDHILIPMLSLKTKSIAFDKVYLRCTNGFSFSFFPLFLSSLYLNLFSPWK